MINAFIRNTGGTNIAMLYCICQFFAFLFMVSSMYRIMSYHVRVQEVDTTKIIDVYKLWNVIQRQYSMSDEYKNLTSLDDNIPMQLQEIINTYTNKKTPPIKIHTVRIFV